MQSKVRYEHAKKNNITAIVLAAGQGTRMKSSQAKVLHQILGRPMIAYLLDTLKEVGVSDIVVVVGHQAEAVQEALGSTGCASWSRSPSWAPATRSRWPCPRCRGAGPSWSCAAMPR